MARLGNPSLASLLCLGAALPLACAKSEASPSPPAAKSASPVEAPPAPSAPGAPIQTASTSRPAAAASCPGEMAKIPGGPFKMGSDSPSAAPEDAPAFATRVGAFCLDLTEVTTVAYTRCLSEGACTAAHERGRFCNGKATDRDDHPINCVDWQQAQKFCAWRGARLPSELEWEYAARGGDEYRAYSWGKEPPDGRTCWKHVGGTCKTRAFAPGAFGLYDMIGNVWEWTDDWFGEFPWPAASGTSKVYRGGSWSRRFEKWMSPRLRNRFRPREQGSHLGFRCALTPSDTQCPYGRSADGTRCLHGVDSASCKGRDKWNGVRCAPPGESGCPAGSSQKPGHGCVSDVSGASIAGLAPKGDETPITRSRSPEFDADCAAHKPGRPHAYRYSGGTHAGRNRESGGAGCSNRDVGVGWNSTCCP